MAGRILIVDDVATNRIVMKVRLATSRHATLLAADGIEALRLTRECHPDLVLLDLDLPEMDGLSVLQALRADPASRDIPVIVHTATPLAEARLAALRAGADDVFVKPSDERLLMARIRNLLRRRDPDETLQSPLFALQEQADPFDWPGLVAMTGFTAQGSSRFAGLVGPLLPHRLQPAAPLGPAGDPPDAWLIDATAAPPGPAFALLSELRSAPDSRHTGIAVLTDGPASAAMAYDLGADEAICPRSQPEEIALRLNALIARSRAAARQREQLRDNVRLAMIDPLTGLFNRRYALRRMGEMSLGAVGGGGGVGTATMIVDIDRFKQINDRFGHATGDAVLVEVARRLQDHLTDEDMIARIGGEEFLIALPRRALAEARHLADGLRAAIHDRPVQLADGASVTLTISIGLCLAPPGTLPDDAIDRADRALLAAKLQGRNRVIVGRSAA
ncbi:MAG: diguanylate cyclase [Paracoccaceae bacterium]